MGRNFGTPGYLRLELESPSSRRAWVEISLENRLAAKAAQVALLAEGVGRNIGGGADKLVFRVALLAEGVGRN